MCNGLGWDIAFYDDHISVEQHFCREYGDCGHSDNTLEEAADDVAAAYQHHYDWLVLEADGRVDFVEDEDEPYLVKSEEDPRDAEKKAKALAERDAWLNRTHKTYLYYKYGIDIE